MPSQDDVARYRDNRQDEMNSAALYRTFAALEPQKPLSQIYERLVTVEERHARFWEQHLRAAGASVPPSPGSRQPAAARSLTPPPCRHAVTCQSLLTRSPGAALTTAALRTRLLPRRACCSTPCGERARPGTAWARKMLKRVVGV
jgi:hypothetical protein